MATRTRRAAAVANLPEFEQLRDTARDIKKQTAGQITLTFTDAPLALQGWSVTDAQGRATRVALSGLTPSPGLDPSLFVLKDPRPKNVGRGKM